MIAVRLINSLLKRRRRTGPQVTIPEVYYVTYTDNPRTTADLMWHTEGDTFQSVLFKKDSDTEWNEIESQENKDHPFTGNGFSRDLRIIRRVHLDNLEPGEIYNFKFSDNSVEKKFKTLDSYPIRAILTSDAHCFYESNYRSLASVMGGQNPDVLVCNGDLASADGLESRFDRWDIWWQYYVSELVRSDGCLIPIIPNIGNHDVVGGFGGSIPSDAPYFYANFPISQAYRTVDIGTDLSFVMLDSGHTYKEEIDGTDTQSVWLSNALSERSDFKHVLPMSHVGGYPFSRLQLDGLRGRIRDHWHPIYEANNIKLVLNGHEHMYAETEIINGVKYLGGGCWGPPVRDAINFETTEFLKITYGEKYTEGVDGPGDLDGEDAIPFNGRYFYLAHFTDSGINIKSINRSGDPFTEFST